MMPGRTYVSSTYRYGMNGQEKDDEIFNGAYTAEYWEYDSRILRRWNKDPITYAWQSPYACFNGNPIYFADPDGLEGDPPVKKGDKIDLGGGKSCIASCDETEVVTSKIDTPKAATTGAGGGVATNNTTKNNPANPTNPSNLMAVNTSLTSYVKPGPHLSFDGTTASAGAGMGLAGAETSVERYSFNKSDNNIHTINGNYNVNFLAVDGNNSSQFGAGTSYNYLYGDMLNIDPFEDPANRIEVSNDMSINATVGVVQVGYNGGDMSNGGFSYNAFGVGFGGKVKANIKPITSNLPASMSGGLYRRRLGSKHTPSNGDSINTALKHPSNSRSSGILQRNGYK